MVKKIENKNTNQVFFIGDNYVAIVPTMRNNVLCPDNTRRAVLLCGKSDKIEYVFGSKKDATYGFGFPEPTRLELINVLVNGKSSWTIGEKFHKHIPCNVDKVAEWLIDHYKNDFLGSEQSTFFI